MAAHPSSVPNIEQKVAVVGSRTFTDFNFLEQTLNQWIQDHGPITTIVSGGAPGADTLAEQYAAKYSIPTLIFKADWSKGKWAGLARNKDIVENADIIIAYPWGNVDASTGIAGPPNSRDPNDSKGTRNTMETARKQGKPVYNMTEQNLEDKQVAIDEFDFETLKIYYTNGVDWTKPVIAFDLDRTLIKTKSGNVKFAKNVDDWQWFHDNVPTKLSELSKTHQIVIFTNQGRVESKLAIHLAQIKQVLTTLNLPMVVYIALGKYGKKDKYRKPAIGMYQAMLSNYALDKYPQPNTIIYVGDSAGRPADPSKGRLKKDHSNYDLNFARAVGLTFMTPEAFFLGQKDELPGVNPEQLLVKFSNHPIPRGGNHLKYVGNKDSQLTREMIMMVGYPGSGKSTLITQLPNYTIISQDEIGSKAKCQQACLNALSSGQSVIIDRTNLTVEQRQPYLQLAAQVGVPCRCLLMDVTRDEAYHMNVYRGQTGGKEVPKEASVYKTMEEPELSEGFASIEKVKPNLQIPKFNLPLFLKNYPQLK